MGRPGNPPAWPLTKASARERELWRRLWKSPQALGWEWSGVEPLTVALFVRRLAVAESPEATTSGANLVRQQADGLGLSAPGMRMLRWRVARQPFAEPADDPVRRTSSWVPGMPTHDAEGTPVPGVPARERMMLLNASYRSPKERMQQTTSPEDYGA